MEGNSSYFQTLLVEVNSNQKQIRERAQLNLMTMNNYMFRDSLLNLMQNSSNINAIILALIALKNKAQQSEFMDSHNCKAFLNELTRIYFSSFQSVQLEYIAECIGILAVHQLQHVSDILLSAFSQIQLNSRQFYLLLLLQSKVIQLLNKQAIRAPFSKKVLELFSQLLKHLQQYYCKLQLKCFLLATIALRVFCQKKIYPSFKMLLSFLIHADEGTKTDLSQNDLIIREWCHLLQESFYKMKIRCEQFIQLYKYLMDNVQSIKLYQQETITIWLRLFSLCLKFLLTNGLSEIDQNQVKQIILGQDNFTIIFWILFNAFNSSDDSSVDLRNVCSEILRLFRDYTDQSTITQFLKKQIQIAGNVNSLQDHLNFRSTYLYIISNLINEIQPLSILQQILKDLQQDIAPRLLISSLHFVSCLISSGKIQVTNLIQSVHPILLQLLQKNHSLIIRRQIFHVMTSYLHISVPEVQLVQIINEIFKFIDNSCNQEEIINIIEDLLEVCSSNHLKHLIHQRVLVYIKNNILGFTNITKEMLHIISKIMHVLSETVYKSVNTENEVYYLLFISYISSNFDILKDSILALITKLLIICDNKVTWIVQNPFHIELISNFINDRSRIYQLSVILIQLSAWLPKTIQKICIKILEKHYALLFNSSLMALVNILSIQMQKQFSLQILERVLQQLKSADSQDIKILCMKLIIRKGSYELARKFPIQMNHSNILKLKLFHIKIIKEYMEISTKGGQESIWQIQNALKGMSFQQKSHQGKRTSNFIGMYRKQFCDYHYLKHSKKVLDILNSESQ